MSEPAPTSDRVRAKIAAWKASLLDLSARNPLVALPEEGLIELPAPNDVYEPLLRRRKPLTFWDLGNKELDRAVLREPANYPARSGAWSTFRHLRLQALSLLQGQDVNALYVVFGVLGWKDPGTGRAMRSPLLMVPVTLERSADGASYVITRSQEEDVEVNPVLAHRLALPDIDVKLPNAPEEAYLIPSAYLRGVGELVEGRDGWEVEDRTSLGLFPLLKMRLYEDLVAQEKRAEEHPLVAALAGEIDALERLPSVTVPALSEIGEIGAESEQFLLLDADPAQQRAALAAARSQSFVLQGPPGTGKTQTVANIICECVAANKSVLLVSGRMASLDAVERRLADRGLADLCLSAHSLKTTKRDILTQLEAGLSSPAGGARGGKAAKKDLEVLDALRKELDTFAKALHEPRPELGLTVYEANGIVAEADAEARRAGSTEPLLFEYEAPLTVTPQQYAAMEEAVRSAAADPALGDAAESSAIWYAAFADPDRPDLRAEVEKAVKEAGAAVQVVSKKAAALAQQLGIAAPGSVHEAERLLSVGDVVSDITAPLAPEWLTQDAATLSSHADRVTQFQERYMSARSERTAFLSSFDVELLALDHEPLRHRLTQGGEKALKPLLGDSWQSEAVAKESALADVLASIAEDARDLYGALSHLATTCGMAELDESFEGKQRLLRIALRAAEIPTPAVGWFTPGAPQSLIQLMNTVRGQWFKYGKLREELLAVYTDRILELDHAGLLDAVSSQPSGLGRLVNTASMRVANVLKSAAQPGANVKDRDLTRDLQNAALMKEILHWIHSNEPAFVTSFGPHYRGATTDWEALKDAMLKAEALGSDFSTEGGRVPGSLVAVLAAGGEPLEAFREKQASIPGLFARLRTHWDALSQLVRSAALPEPQSSLQSIAAWCDDRIAALKDFTDAYRTVAAFRRAGEKAPTVAMLIEDLESAQRLRQDSGTFAEAMEALRDACGGRYKGKETDWDGVRAGLESAAAVRVAFGNEAPPPTLTQLLTKPDSLTKKRGTIIAALKEARAAHEAIAGPFQALGTLFRPAYLQADGRPLPDTPFDSLAEWLAVRAKNTALIQKAVQGQGARDRSDAVGLGSFFDAVAAAVAAGRSDVRSPETLVALFRSRFHLLWLDAVAETAPVLKGFTGPAYDKDIDTFRDLDRKYLDAAPGRIREMTRARSPKQFAGEVKELKDQLARRRTGEVRKILARIPNLLFALKPCVMMNPLSVRLFLDADALQFDVVLFDDASQIATEDAIGAILRGRQVIVAGDPKQLPPLSLVHATATDDTLLPLPAASGESFESVLDAAGSVADVATDRFSRYSLNWHYRSQNETLIAFSRRHFYPGLVSFPSATVGAGAIQYVPVADGKDDAESGSSHSTERVVDVTLDYRRRFPDRSIGVITMTEVDYARLLDAFARRRESDPEAAGLETDGADHDGAAFFVKMIENVQGDERDLIVLHMGADPAQFGAMLEPDSDRLLNVATTRARCDMVIVSALPPGALAASQDAADSSGIALLRAFLEYAADPSVLIQEAAIRSDADLRPDPFVSTLRAALADKGYDLRERIGLSAYRVDLGVIDPSDPSRYLLGIECDGPTYVTAGTARHRDRLCPDMLAMRGWNLHRVWSLDWNRDQAGQIKRIQAAVAAAKKAAAKPAKAGKG